MGVVFLLVGIAGFIPGITSGVDELQFVGHHSSALLLGLFQVSIFHNIVHLLFGVVGIAASRSVKASRLYLLIGGVVYLLLWIYGLVVPHDSQLNFVPLNSADNWLHLCLAAGMIGFGALLTPSMGRSRG